jgi:hydrogenase expression/formation protein HypE
MLSFANKQIQLAHGSGGKLMHQLIEEIFATTILDPRLGCEHDGAVFDFPEGRMAFTTDSFVVDPLFFPGGDIGTLAVCGTVNDLAVCGARPIHLSAGFIIEEGFSTKDLLRIAQSMRRAAEASGVTIVTGDTKVVDRGRGHGVFINTAGVGAIDHDLLVHPRSIVQGDAVMLSGDIGRHGIAVLAEREGLSFESRISSDVAPINGCVMALIESGIDVHCLRDLTRGGLATALVELAGLSGKGIRIEENSILVSDEVKGACEILGFDPLYVANEGRFVAFLPAEESARALDVVSEYEAEPRIIGLVTDPDSASVTLTTCLGVERTVEMLSGDQFPRIC